MILVFVIIIPLLAGIIAWFAASKSRDAARWISLCGVSLNFLISIYLWYSFWPGKLSQSSWLLNFQHDWIPQFGISFHLAMDGISLLMIVLTMFLGIAAIMVSWREITTSVGFFHFNLCAVLSGVIGVFLAIDLILFYFFWELMLVPMYFLIMMWGHENRIYAGIKFFIFTQLGGLFMLVSILGLYFIHGRASGTYTFDYFQLLGTVMDPITAWWLMLGFFVAFAVKLPMVFVHTWLPDAHTEAPTAGSVLLAGLLLKTGGYGFLRFVQPLFPGASMDIAPYAMILGVIGIIYGALMALAQSDAKRLVAYSSISHLGFVLLGIFAATEMAMQGAVFQMISHGISTGALFMIVGMLQERIHTRDMNEMGGLWSVVPFMSGIALIFALASLGLPGMGNFDGEFLVLAGAYKIRPDIAAPAALGLIFSAIYSLLFVYRIFFGEKQEDIQIRDLTGREFSILASMAIVIIWLGLHPQPVINTASPGIQTIRKEMNQAGHNAADLNGRAKHVLAATKNHNTELTE